MISFRFTKFEFYVRNNCTVQFLENIIYSFNITTRPEHRIIIMSSNWYDKANEEEENEEDEEVEGEYKSFNDKIIFLLDARLF